MRLPAPSYAAEAVLGASVVVLTVAVAWPDVPRRPRPVVAIPGRPVPGNTPDRVTPVPVVPPAPVTPGKVATTAVWGTELEVAEVRRREIASEWAAKVAAGRYPMEHDPVRAADVRANHLMGLRAETVGAFEATTGRDAPWADLARAALELRARKLATELLTGQVAGTLIGDDAAALARAVAAGCNDPLIAYWHQRASTPRGELPPDLGAFRDAVERLCQSPYPPVRRAHAVLNWLFASASLPADHALRADGVDWEERFWEVYTAAARERDLVTDEELVDLAEYWQLYRMGQRRTRDQALSELDRHLRRAGARDYLRRTVRGVGLVNVAWDARGGGTGDTVTDDALQVFFPRLEEAREVLLSAAEADPDGYTALTWLLTVCFGLGADRDEMEEIFQRAIAANPDNARACDRKLEYLHPKWHGSRDGVDYLTFAWAVALYPGDGDLPAVVINNLMGNHRIHGPRFDADRRPAAVFYQTDAAFQLFWTACRRMEVLRPRETYYANLLARVACVGNRYDIARVLFGRIGPTQYAPGVFADQTEYDRYRSEAGVLLRPR